MGFCPICKTSSNLEQPAGGDYRRVECRKCGKFQITGSALAMLESRLNDAKSAARLSHATRAMSSRSGVEWPEINSFNLDDMIKHPLPSIDRQMTNLLAWAATELGDDQLGSVEIALSAAGYGRRHDAARGDLAGCDTIRGDPERAEILGDDLEEALR